MAYCFRCLGLAPHRCVRRQCSDRGRRHRSRRRVLRSPHPRALVSRLLRLRRQLAQLAPCRLAHHDAATRRRDLRHRPVFCARSRALLALQRNARLDSAGVGRGVCAHRIGSGSTRRRLGKPCSGDALWPPPGSKGATGAVASR
eukprot:Amastigsp_a841295_63.p2 type:complete len:144 gc:universal Amastigsp_a841295_63:507-76(-)